jgi:hypothetical protein
MCVSARQAFTRARDILEDAAAAAASPKKAGTRILYKFLSDLPSSIVGFSYYFDANLPSAYRFSIANQIVAKSRNN